MMTARKPYPSDVSNDEWALVAPYLTSLRESAEQRAYPMREVFNGLRYLARYGVAFWPCMSRPPTKATARQSRLLAEAVQDVTGESVTLAHVDQGYTGERAEAAAAKHGISLEVAKLPDAKRGFVLLPRREDGFAVLPFRGIACGDGGRAVLRLDGALP